MEFYLSFNNNEEVLRLPVLPSFFEVVTGNVNTVVNINEIGNINLIGKKDLNQLSLESFFPAQDYYFLEYRDYPEPYECVNLIEKWKESSRPIRLVITETNVNIAVAIDSFIYGERDGTGDVYYSLELSEYVFTKSRQALSRSGYAKLPASDYQVERPSRDIPTKYVVKPGDTLSIIAKKVTGNSANYKRIAKKNNIKNPDIIKIGQVLEI